MTFISKKIIFIHVPKSAGTSIKTSLSKDFKLEIHKGILSNEHQTFRQIIKINKKINQNRISFAVVRNPFERFVSIFRFIMRPFKLQKWYGAEGSLIFEKYNNFEKFTESYSMPLHFWHGCDHLSPQLYWAEGVDKIFKIEEKSEIESFLSNLGSTHQIGHENKKDTYSGHNKMYRDYYNENTKKIIYKAFEKDLDSFKYTF